MSTLRSRRSSRWKMVGRIRIYHASLMNRGRSYLR